MAQPPFDTPRRDYDDSPGWSLGNHSEPTWRKDRQRQFLDAASVHELVRRADLPICELRHMGWVPALLSPAVEWVPVERVSPLLGRIMWDYAYGNEGEVWKGLHRQCLEANRLGRRVIKEHFRG